MAKYNVETGRTGKAWVTGPDGKRTTRTPWASLADANRHAREMNRAAALLATAEPGEDVPNVTDVLFRIDRHGKDKIVTAVFPGEAGTVGDPWSVTVYDSQSGHGLGSMDWVRTKTRTATEAEYADIYRQLTRTGYVLRIVKRSSAVHLAARREQTKR